MKKNIFLYHIIYLIFFSVSFSQNLHLELKGKDSISNNYLKKRSFRKSFSNIKTLNQELIVIKKNLNNNGYFNAHIKEKTKKNDSTYVTELKLNTHFNNITITFNPTQINTRELHNSLEANTKINQNTFTTNTSALEKNINNIIKHLADKGQVFSNCQLTNIEIKDNEVFAKLNLITTKTNLISGIRIKNYEKFPKKFIKHFLRLKSNQPLNITDIEEKSTRLNYLRFASEAKKPELLFTKDSTITYLYINKKKANSFEGFLGFSSNPDTEKLDINGNINLQLINNLNSGEEVYLKYQSTENEQKKINIKAVIPYNFNSPFSLEGEFDIFKKDSSFTNNTQSIQTKYDLNKNIKIGTGLRFNSSNSLTEDNTNNLDLKKTSYLFNFTHQTPNKTSDFFRTKTKTLLELSLTKRKTPEQTDSQQNVFLTSEYTFQINRTNSFFIKTEGNYLISNNIFNNEHLYIGGINSIRGYQENSIPSTQYNTLNTEYRIELNQTLYTHTVIDYTITKNITTNNFDNLFGFGLGFGLKTNNSLLRFIIANKKSKDETIKFSESKIHLSLSTLF